MQIHCEKNAESTQRRNHDLTSSKVWRSFQFARRETRLLHYISIPLDSVPSIDYPVPKRIPDENPVAPILR